MNGHPFYQKWSRDSKAARALRQGIQDGDIDPNAPPKHVYESNPLFQQYKLDSFRSAFNKTKTELGCHVRGGGGSGKRSSSMVATGVDDDDEGKFKSSVRRYIYLLLTEKFFCHYSRGRGWG